MFLSLLEFSSLDRDIIEARIEGSVVDIEVRIIHLVTHITSRFEVVNVYMQADKI